jgi:sugar phosphate isomerase/epimerase
MPNHVIVSTLNWSTKTLEEAVGAVAALEFGQIDLALHEGRAHIDPSALAAGGPDAVRREAERVQGLIARLEMRRTSAFSVDLGTRGLADHAPRFAGVCELARALAVPVLTLMSAPTGTLLADEAGRLAALLPVAADRGIQLTVPTYRDQVTSTLEAVLQLCEAVPGLGVTLDVGHLYAGPHRSADYSALLPLVKHVYLRDATVDHPQVPAGSGSVDFGGIVSRLHAAGYEGKFAIVYDDRVPTLAAPGGSVDTEANVIRMRDVFVAAERAAGIVRSGPPPVPAP